jgi:hypothetical protein
VLAKKPKRSPDPQVNIARNKSTPIIIEYVKSHSFLFNMEYIIKNGTNAKKYCGVVPKEKTVNVIDRINTAVFKP